MQTHGQMLKVMCQRVKNFLPLFTDSTYCSTCVVFVASEFLEQTIPHERETIVTFSKTRLESVLLILGKILGSLTEKNYSPQDPQFEKLEQSFVILMELLIQSLEASYKMSYEEIRKYQTKFKKKIVSDQIANEVSKIVYNIYFMREHDSFTEMVYKYCGVLFTRISHANYEVVYSKVTTILEKIQNKLTEEFKSNELKLIQHLDYDQQKLSGLLTKITLLAGEIPKVYQIPIVNVVRQGIWNWIDYHPEQFTEFYRSGKKMQGNPEILFQKILDWSTSVKKKVQYQYWPLLTMLLVLCPKIILQIGTNDKNILKSATGKFFENLKKIFKGKDQKKVQTSARCLIDFCKAATYVAKSDQTGLRLMVPKIQELVAPKLLNQKKLLITDVDLLVDFLVSSFRLTPTETTKEHYNACLHPNSSPIFKLVLIKGLVQIAQEKPLEWNPSIEKTYSRAVDMELANMQMIIVEESLKLFSADPDFALVSYAINSNNEKKMLSGEIKILFTTLPQCIDNSLITQEKIVLWLNLLLDILRKRNKFLIGHLKDEVLSGRIKLTHDQANTRIENALLMLLCNSDPIIVTQTVECIDCLCQELKLLNEINNTKNTIAASYQNYKKMYQMGRYVTSRIAQQKNIRSLFRRIDTATTGNKPAWTKIHQKWGEKSERILKFERMIEYKSENVSKSKKMINLEDYNQNLERLEWENDLGFLISLAAVAKKIVLRSTIKKSNDKPNLTNSGSSGCINQIDEKEGIGQVVIGTFLGYILELIVSDITYIRGAVVKIITQMSTSVYYIFFKKIQELIKNDFKIWADGKAGIFEKVNKSQIAVRFLDQIIFVLRGILEQPLTMDDLANVEIENLFITMIKAISRFVVDIPNFSVKIKMCKLITLLMEKKDFILFKRELMFRNELVELLMEWFSDFQKKTISKSKSNTFLINENNNENSTNNSNSNNTSKQTFDEILKNINPKNQNNLGNKIQNGSFNEKLNQMGNENNTNKEAKKMKKLINEVDLFAMEAITKLLDELPLQKRHGLRAKNVNNSGSSNISEEEKKISQLTVIALSYMLHANVNVGLRHTLPMGYVKNLVTRSEFLDVFTNILKQGTEFGNLKETLEDKYRNLIEMILDKDLIVTKAICEIIKVTEMDLLAGILIRINRTRGSDIELLKFMIETEVNNNPIDQPSTLFRRNSFASKMMSAYSKTIGRQYLKKALSDLIQTTINDIMVNKKGIEIDQRKLKQDENLDENLKNLLELTQVYFNKIMNSLGFFFLRFICPAIISPENADLVKERIPVEVRRALILITKALQNLANGVMFGNKEEFMIPLNKFIKSNQENFNQLVIKLSNANYLDNLNNGKVTNNLQNEQLKDKENNNNNDDNEENEPEEIIDEEISSKDLNSLHQFLYLNLQNLSVYFKRLKDNNQVKKGENFVTILTQLGKPSDAQQKQTEEKKTNNQNMINNEIVETNFKKKSDKNYQRFIETMKGKENELQQFNNVIYHKGESKKNESVIYVVNRKIVKDNCDYQLLLYHILIMIKPLINKPYIIILDLTNFKKNNEIPKYWCNQFLKTYSIWMMSNNYLQIVQLKENLFNQNCNLIDFIHFSNIKSISKTINTQDQFILDMIIDNKQKNINYKCSQFVSEIVHSINTIKEKYDFSQKTSQKKNKKKIPEIRPSDVPGSLLNIALLNLGSQSENLRKSSYNLLTALCNSFRFTMSGQLLEADGLSIPQSHTSFVVNLSKAISQNEKHITLEFLYEAVKHYNEASSEGKHLCLMGMGMGIRMRMRMKKIKVTIKIKMKKKIKNYLLKKIIVNLLNITLQENKLYPAILVHIWKSISSVIELFELVLNVFVEQSIAFGINTIKSERIAQIVVTVSSSHPEIFSKLICKKLLNCLFLASHQEIKDTTITSNDNNSNVTMVEKDIFHFIINTHWVNSFYLRSWLLSLAINILHSLSTKLPPKMEKDYEILVKLLKEISDIRFRMLFTGTGVKQNEILTNKNQNLIPHNLSEIPIVSTEKITQLFNQVLKCYKNDTEIYNKWQNKWIQTTTKCTFDNSIIQCRSFVILGVITDEEVKTELIKKILSYFSSLLGNLDFANQTNRDLCSSILISLTHLYPLIEKESDLLFTMFWLPIILFEIGDQYYFSYALDMLNVILNYLDEQQVFDENSLETVFMTVRNDNQILDKSLTRLENIVGINFHSHFSFALSSLLLQSKGNSTVKVKMISIFRKVIEISCKTELNYPITAYIVGLSTCIGRKEVSELREFLRNYIDWEGEFEQLIFSPIMNHNNNSATLLVSLLTAILVQSDYEQEHQYILELLMPSIDSYPTVYNTIQHHFLPKLFQIIDRSQNSTVHQLALNLSFFLLSYKEPPISNFMEKIGFHGIYDLLSEKTEPVTIRSKRKLIPKLLSLLF
ncbi:gtpase-activator protein for ras-like gtpases [Anaeramoeba flamelloides]|uniref:Gtpase-activator protein for ras-like gtpases n=1 Tax=Anaeramoeba flamelloides TaxID=1746091 RepID=A0AAV8AJL4_9EUKA|nr:gtpase-activator protein for ras-like gtpases [Anaeramoeba flamelloides]